MDINDLLKHTVDSGASDLHLTVGVPPIMRRHGKLTSIGNHILGPQNTEKFAREMLTDELLKVLEEKGEVDFSLSRSGISRFRVNIYRQRETIAVALRVVASEIPEPDKLGIPKAVIDLYSKTRGLILVTGPTGSGKSTTLASLINIINREREAHILTLEDPIEYLHKHRKSIVNQREIGSDTKSYANALRAALRQDPDVILVGEMRDLETISIAITAAETGHLVLSTLHTIGAAKTIDRIIDVFPPYQQQQIRVQMSSVLQAVISQQLIKRKNLEGRVAAIEVMLATPAISNLIREGKTHQINSIIQTGAKYGMQTMDNAILQLYREGKISRESAIIYAVDTEYVNKMLSGGGVY